MQKNSSISCRQLKSVQFCLFWFKFGCHGNSLGSLKNSDSVLKFTSPEIPTVHAITFLICCRELMSAIFWPKFGCHGNHPDSHEILYTIFEFAYPENLVINSSISGTGLKSVQFWLILFKFGCHGNSLGSLEN